MSTFPDVDDDTAGIYLDLSTGEVRFLSFDNNGSNILSDVQLARADVERIRDTLTEWLDKK